MHGLHQTVLLNEAVEALKIKSGGVYIDGTFGRGGHAQAILEKLGQDGRLLAIDKDPEAVAAGKKKFEHDGRFSIARGSFAMLKQLAVTAGLSGKVDGILLDLGVSSPQLDNPDRGFSFMKEGPLDMRMDTESGISAAQWLANVSEEELSDVIKTFGEERFHRRVARAIVAARQETSITTTTQLAEIVAGAIPKWEKHKHPATRTFQAIRIFINSELDDIKTGLQQALDILDVGGRLVVISFHSLEDRIVKRFIRDQAKGKELPPDLPVMASDLKPRLRKIGKAIYPDNEEIKHNPRARSAVMRVAECLA
jgi:16S rRNA (cytosine1402-N4)-methyltransferase